MKDLRSIDPLKKEEQKRWSMIRNPSLRSSKIKTGPQEFKAVAPRRCSARSVPAWCSSSAVAAVAPPRLGAGFLQARLQATRARGAGRGSGRAAGSRRSRGDRCRFSVCAAFCDVRRTSGGWAGRADWRLGWSAKIFKKLI